MLDLALATVAAFAIITTATAAATTNNCYY